MAIFGNNGVRKYTNPFSIIIFGIMFSIAVIAFICVSVPMGYFLQKLLNLLFDYNGSLFLIVEIISCILCIILYFANYITILNEIEEYGEYTLEWYIATIVSSLFIIFSGIVINKYCNETQPYKYFLLPTPFLSISSSIMPIIVTILTFLKYKKVNKNFGIF